VLLVLSVFTVGVVGFLAGSSLCSFDCSFCQCQVLVPPWSFQPPWIFHGDGVVHQEKKKLRPERPDTLDALDASDATCLTPTQFAMAPCIRTQLATASAYRTERVRAFSFWTQPCQGIFLLDAAVSGHFPSGRCRVRANGVWTTRVMAPRSRWLSRHGTSQQILLSHSQTRSGFQA